MHGTAAPAASTLVTTSEVPTGVEVWSDALEAACEALQLERSAEGEGFLLEGPGGEDLRPLVAEAATCLDLIRACEDVGLGQDARSITGGALGLRSRPLLRRAIRDMRTLLRDALEAAFAPPDAPLGGDGVIFGSDLQGLPRRSASDETAPPVQLPLSVASGSAFFPQASPTNGTRQASKGATRPAASPSGSSDSGARGAGRGDQGGANLPLGTPVGSTPRVGAPTVGGRVGAARPG